MQTVEVSALTAGYRIPAYFERSGLIEQNIDYATLGVSVLYPDMAPGRQPDR